MPQASIELELQNDSIICSSYNVVKLEDKKMVILSSIDIVKEISVIIRPPLQTCFLYDNLFYVNDPKNPENM